MLTSAALLLSLTSLLAASADSVGYSPKISIRALPNSEIHHLEIYGAPAGPDFVRELVFEKVNDTPYGFKLTAIGLSGHNGQGAPANPSPPAGGWQAGTGTFTYVLAGKDPISVSRYPCPQKLGLNGQLICAVSPRGELCAGIDPRSVLGLRGPRVRGSGRLCAGAERDPTQVRHRSQSAADEVPYQVRKPGWRGDSSLNVPVLCYGAMHLCY